MTWDSGAMMAMQVFEFAADLLNLLSPPAEQHDDDADDDVSVGVGVLKPLQIEFVTSCLGRF